MPLRKYMSVKEFVERGFLQEINRRILHPCGVALIVHEWDGTFEFAGVWDARDDPEGIVFAEKEPPDYQKRNRVNEEWNVHIEGRGKGGLNLDDPFLRIAAGGGVQLCPELGE